MITPPNLNPSTPLREELESPVLIQAQRPMMEQGASRAEWIERLSQESPERAYLQGLVYLDEALGWTEQLEEFLVLIIDACRKIPGFEQLRKKDGNKWRRADDIRRHYQTTPHKVNIAWNVVAERWGEDVAGLLKKLGIGYIYASSCRKLSRAAKWNEARLTIQQCTYERISASVRKVE